MPQRRKRRVFKMINATHWLAEERQAFLAEAAQLDPVGAQRLRPLRTWTEMTDAEQAVLQAKLEIWIAQGHGSWTTNIGLIEERGE
jgi:hypothetical protein